jgi:flagella basal body P-ring formation protein FlgA
MNRLIRIALGSLLTGFVIPTLAFATLNEPPAAQNATYLFKLARADAQDAISFALADKGAGNKILATIAGLKSDDIFSYDRPISVEIRDLQFDQPSQRWSANLLFISDTQVVSAMPVAGRFEEVIEVPVLKRQVRSGDTIAEKDIEIRDFPLSSTRSDTITDIASLVGKSPLRVISPARPIREQEVVSPSIVKKNALVQMRYSIPGMEISTAGQAMEDGAKGSVINVRNIASKKTIQAVIADSNTVHVVNESSMQSSQLAKGSTHDIN